MPHDLRLAQPRQTGWPGAQELSPQHVGRCRARDIGLGQTDLELPALGDTRIPLVITVDAARARPGLTFGLAAECDLVSFDGACVHHYDLAALV